MAKSNAFINQTENSSIVQGFLNHACKVVSSGVKDLVCFTVGNVKKIFLIKKIEGQTSVLSKDLNT